MYDVGEEKIYNAVGEGAKVNVGIKKVYFKSGDIKYFISSINNINCEVVPIKTDGKEE